MKNIKMIGLASAIALSAGMAQAGEIIFDQDPVSNAPQPTPPGETTLLGTRILQDDVVSGRLSLQQMIEQGERMFTGQFNRFDGHGDGPVAEPGEDKVAPGGRPTLDNNGQFLRINGLDSQTCNECHTIVSNATTPAILGVAGVGGVSQSAFPGIDFVDVGDLDNDGIANINDPSRGTNGRFINPPFLFGSGGIEQLGKEITRDLQALKAEAIANPGRRVRLISKGVDFGSIMADEFGSVDTSRVEGINEDLAMTPLGRKGTFSTTREFDFDAMSFHFGMQAVELVGLDVDADGDGVVNEITIGEISVLHIHNALLPPSAQRLPEGTDSDSNQQRRSIRRGERIFDRANCDSCHIPFLDTDSSEISFSFPVVPTDPDANIYFTADLRDAGFAESPVTNGVRVPMFSDLKRHDMGPGLAESTSDPLAAFFITPRLWGIADTAPYLHDGRAITLTEAITLHGGEGQFASDNFQALSNRQKTDLLNFLRSLRTPGSGIIGPQNPNPLASN